MKKLLLLLAIGLAVAACSGNSSSSKQVKPVGKNVGVSGRIDAGMSSSRVSATPINSEGGPTQVTNDAGNAVFDGAASQSDSNGDFSLNIDSSLDGTALIFIATSDNGTVSYRCEVLSGCSGTDYLDYVELSDDLDIRAGVGEVAPEMIVNVNWVTDLAASLAKTVYIDEVTNNPAISDRDDIDSAILADLDTAKTGIYNEYTMELANLHISSMFALSDVIYVTPIGPSQITKSYNVSAERLQESIYLGAIISALPVLSEERNSTYMALLSDITENLIARNGQLLQKNSSTSEVSLSDIYSKAADILGQNITQYRSQGARVPSAADDALTKLEAIRDGLVDGEETSISVDVPAELAGWTTTIEEAEIFIDDLTEAVKNFWGYNPDESSFIDPAHARRMDSYYLAHEALYNQLSPSLTGPGSVLDDMLAAAEVLIACQYGAGDCSPADARYVISSGTEENGGAAFDRVTIDDSLTLILKAVVDADDVEATTFNQFDFEIDGEKNSLTKDVNGLSTTFIWNSDVISDGSVVSAPYFRLYYEEKYTSPPSLGAVEPRQVAVVWPLISFDQVVDGSEEPGTHTFRLLFEANLVGVKDPLDAGSELRYNPVTLVFWVRSVQYEQVTVDDSDTDADGIQLNELNISSMISQIRTTNSLGYYPEQKWPGAAEFFKSRTDSPATITAMVPTLYRGIEALSDDVTVDVFDSEVLGNPSINRIRMYPYDSTQGTTRTQSCNVNIVDGERVASECSDSIYLAGEVTLDELIESNYENGQLSEYVIAANGTYSIDLSDYGLIDGEGNFNGMVVGVEYGPFDGSFVAPVQLGISTMSVALNSNLLNEEGEYIPTAAELALSREVDDIYSASLAYSYGADESYDFLSDAIGVGVGANAQAFVVEYAVTEEELANENDELETIEIERGAWTVYRSGVTLGGDEQSVLSHIITRTEYTQGGTEEACGLNDRDKLSSAGDCDAVAYLTVRGSLVGTIREERDGVFVARFVDGTWMIIGD